MMGVLVGVGGVGGCMCAMTCCDIDLTFDSCCSDLFSDIYCDIYILLYFFSRGSNDKSRKDGNISWLESSGNTKVKRTAHCTRNTKKYLVSFFSNYHKIPSDFLGFTSV